MLYQNILNGSAPYYAMSGIPNKFGEHRHADMEISYCVKGSFEILLDKQQITLFAGDFALISPMTAHSFPESGDPDSERLTVVVGVSFLKNSFSYFNHMKQDFLIVDREKQTKTHVKLRELLSESAALCQCESEQNDLLIQGNLYKICAYLMELIGDPDSEREWNRKERTRVSNIEKALEMIYFHYASPLTLEEAARATGYGKSNFCKIFKEITGHTFHYLLNRQRVQSACDLLAQTALSVSEIAQQVGFGEAKTFCRLFKEITALTPKEYRRKHADPVGGRP